MSRCGVCGAEATGCQCSLADSDCFSVTGSGSDENPFGIEPILDPDPDNYLTCGSNGLLAKPPEYILNPPAVHIFNSAPQAVASDTTLTLTFNSTRYNTDNMHPIAGKITIQTPGVYEVTLNILWDKNDTGDRQIYIRLNGAEIIGTVAVHAGDADLYVGQSLAIEDAFAADDYLEALARQDSGTTLNVLTDRSSQNFTATFIRPTPT